VPQKGQEILIEVAKQLKRKGYDFEILIAGEGKLKGLLLQKAVEEGVADRVRFMGFVENMPQFMNSIDIFLFPSHWEGFGYVIAEAMYCQKPVVAFNVSSNPEIIRNNETGFLVKHGDVKSFLEKTELLIHDDNLRKIMGQKAKKTAIDRFSIQNTLVIIEHLFYSSNFATQ